MRKANKLLALFLAVLMVVTSMVTMTVTTVSADTAAPVAEETHPTTWWDVNAAPDFAGGSGTEADPYLISTPEQLAHFANYLEGGALDAATADAPVYFKLTTDIDMSAHQWKPIGYSAPYSAYTTHTLNNGVLDGGGYTVTGIKLTASVAMAGGHTYAEGCALFTKITGSSVVKNLSIDVRIVDPVLSHTAATQRSVAGLAAVIYDSVQINGVSVNVDMDVSNGSGTTYFAGLVGCTYSPSLTAAVDTVNVTGEMNVTMEEANTSIAYIGGLFGYYRLKRMDNVYNYATINYVAGYGNNSGVGGLVGICQAAPVGTVAENHGALNIKAHSGGYSYTGGCIGHSREAIGSSIVGLANYGTITVDNYNSVDYLGGVIGGTYHQATDLVGAENHGDIIYNKTSLTNSDYIGGIIGYTTKSQSGTDTELSNVTDCTNTGDITINYPEGLTMPTSVHHIPYIGGIIGHADYVIVNGCTNAGAITINKASTSMRVGGIVGNLANRTVGTDVAAVIDCTNTGNIKLTDAVQYNATYTSGNSVRYVGGVMGNLAGKTVSGCVNEGHITALNAQAHYQIGGISGHVSHETPEITDCTNYGDIIAYDQNGNYHRNLGGILGQSSAATKTTITNCHNYGDLTRDGVVINAYLGGIMAVGKITTITDCSNNGVLTMIAAASSTGGTRYVGGIAGDMTLGGKVAGSQNNGTVHCTGRAGTYYVGGINGRMGENASTTIDGSVNTAEVKVDNAIAGNFHIGGLNGGTFSGSPISNSENYGKVSVAATNNGGTANVGGISGYYVGWSKLENVSNYGDVFSTGTNTVHLGGLAGYLLIGGDTTTAAEMLNVFNQGSVTGFGGTGNKAYGGLVGNLSNDSNRTNFPMYDIVNAVNVGKVQSGSLSGGLVGYTKSSRSGSPETAHRYQINIRNSFAMNTDGTYGLVGSSRCAILNIENCFTDADTYLTYYNQDTLYQGGTSIVINGVTLTGTQVAYNPPTGITHIENVVTLEKARVRLDSMGTDDSGIRFDSYIDKATYDALMALEAAGLTFELGTLIAPTQNLQVASVVSSYDKMEALDAIKVASNNTYVAIPYGGTFFAGENADCLYFAGALNHMKPANYNLQFTAIAYMTITFNGFTVTFYADYDETNEDRARSIAQIATSAFEDRATAEATINGVDYAFKANAANACYLGDYSPYANVQLAKLKAYSAYVNDKTAPTGLSVNGVSIEEYKIVYAQSPIYKSYGSKTGKTLIEDLGNVTMTKNNVTVSGNSYSYTATSETVTLGDVLLGAKYDYDEQTAYRLQKAIYDEYGVTVPVVEDVATAETAYEILVGNTNRAKSQSYAVASLGVDDYLFRIDDTKILVVGGAYGTTWHAVDALEALFASIDEANYNLKMAGNLDGTYKLQKIACIGDSITRGSQAIPDGNDYGGPDGATSKFGSAATEIYLRNFLSYPANLQRLMWKDAVVYNFGRGASRAINIGDNSYYRASPEWNNCLTTANEVAFDLVFMQHGTNDSGAVASGGATREAEYKSEVQAMMDAILATSPDCKFVMNSVPHAFDGNHVARNEKNDENMRRVQKETAQALKAEGYDVYHFDMGEYTRINLVNDGKSPCTEQTTAGDYYTTESAIHGNYYNIYTGTNRNEGTHPNFRGYNKMADGVYEVVRYVLNGGTKPALMINIG